MNTSQNIDMSLDDIIKMNRKKSSKNKSGKAGTKTQAAQNSHRNPSQRGASNAMTRHGKGLLTNKYRKFTNQSNATTSARVTGVKGRSLMRRKLQSSSGSQQQSAANTRQSLRAAVTTRQITQRQALLNKGRGITTNLNQSTSPAGRSGRRKLVRPGFGVLQSDILAQQLEQKKKRLLFKHAIEESNNRSPTTAAATSSRPSTAAAAIPAAHKRQWKRPGTTVQHTADTGTGGAALTVRVNARAQQAQQRRSTVVANRILKQSIQQPIRTRQAVVTESYRHRGGRSRGRGTASRLANRQPGGASVQILSNTIQNLQQQVASLQKNLQVQQREAQRGRRGSFRGRGRGQVRGQSRGGRQTQHTSYVNPARKVQW